MVGCPCSVDHLQSLLAASASFAPGTCCRQLDQLDQLDWIAILPGPLCHFFCNFSVTVSVLLVGPTKRVNSATTPVQGRVLQQSGACITSTTTGNYTTLGLASNPWCLQVGMYISVPASNSSSHKRCCVPAHAYGNKPLLTLPTEVFVFRRLLSPMSHQPRSALCLPYTQLRQCYRPA